MIRIALDRSTVTNAARTGMARYIEELANALRSEPDACLFDWEKFDLWGGIGSGVRGVAREYVRLPSQLRDARIDVYHATASRAPARRLPVPLVITIHDFAAFEYPDMQGSYRGIQIRRQLKRAASLAGRIIVPSESVRRELTLLFPRDAAKTCVVHHGVAPVFRRRRCASSTPVFVTVATLERRTGPEEHLLDLFANHLVPMPHHVEGEQIHEGGENI